MLLITGFKGKHNTSFQLVELCNRDKLFLTNSFLGIDKDIKEIDFSEYTKIIMFGIDKNLSNQIRIEKKAKLNNIVFETNVDIQKINEKFLNNNINSFISNKPTKYLCNYAYFRVLERNENTIFIHIPSLKNMTSEFINVIKDVVNKI